MLETKKSIVIIGAGFGGLQTALKLSRGLKRLQLTDKYCITLVDRNSYHTFTPTLYEAATTTDYVASNSQLKRIIAFPIKELIENSVINFTQGIVTKINTTNKEIHFATGTILAYNYLVLALGSEINYFGIPGLADHSLNIKTFIEALRLREKIIEQVEIEARSCIRIVVGGGGSTGIELAAEIKNLLHELPRVATGHCQDSVTVIDGGATILSVFDERVIKMAEKRLKYLEVEIITGKMIQSVEVNKITLQDSQEINYDLLVWTGGVASNHLMQTLGMKKDPSGKRVITTHEMTCLPESEDLAITNTEKIYGIGDAICFLDQKTNRPVPGVARAAVIQARVVAHNILEEVKAEQELTHVVKLKRYHPMQYPYILPIGGKFAIAKFGPIVISGLPAWIIKGTVEFNYLLSIFPIQRAIKYWLKGLWIFLRNDRLG